MHHLILITGPQDSGKSTIALLMRNSVEIEASGKGNDVILREIWAQKDFKEVVVVTTTSANYVLRRMLENCANELKCKYFHYQI